MPANLQTIIDNTKEILTNINDYHFKNPLLFKTFNKNEEKNFNLMVDDAVENKEGENIRLERLELALTILLDCRVKIYTSHKENIEREIVKFPLHESILISDLETYFGKEWYFNAPEFKEPVEMTDNLEYKPTSQNTIELKKPIASSHKPTFFSAAPTNSLSTELEKFEKNLKALALKAKNASPEIKEECHKKIVELAQVFHATVDENTPKEITSLDMN